MSFSADAHSELTPCVKSSFFFDLVQKEWSTKQGTEPLHRICTLMRKMGVQTFLREKLVINEELEAERSAVEIRKGQKFSIRAIRFTFFRTSPKSLEQLKSKDLLGYAIIVSLFSVAPGSHATSYILESVIRPPAVFDDDGDAHGIANYYIHAFRTFRTTIGTAEKQIEFYFPGTFFSQQNQITHVCGHAALRMAINSSPFYSGEKVTNSEINELIDVDHKITCIKPEGVEVPALLKVIDAKGFQAHAAEFLTRPDIDYQGFCYPLIESGCPVILNIANQRISHVVTLLGHTWNSDRWAEAYQGYSRLGAVQTPEYISGATWADHFIQNDDNFGMYVTLPTEQIRNILVPRYNPNLYAAVAIGLAPKNVKLTGNEAEFFASRVIDKLLTNGIESEKGNPWYSVLVQQASQKQIVLRTIHAEKKAYIAYITSIKDRDENSLKGNEIAILREKLPAVFWVTEMSIPDIYTGNKGKLGEVITRSDLGAKVKANPVVLVWIPGLMIPSDGHGEEAFEWSFKGQVPLLRGPSCYSNNFEW